MEDYSGVTVVISEVLKEKLADWGIKEDDVKTCIGTAEETGVYLRNAEDTTCLAKVKIGDTYIVAEYEKAGGAFTLLDTFCHKTEVTGW